MHHQRTIRSAYCGKIVVCTVGLLTALVGTAAWGQGSQVVNSAPFRSSSHSFYERMGAGFNFNMPGRGSFGGLRLDVNNGFNNAVPQYGGFTPGGGLSGSGGFNTGGGGRFNFFGDFSQGSRSSISSVTPSVTTMNGQIGFVADQLQAPFVISVIPVVGEDTFRDFGPANTVQGRLLRGEITLPSSGSTFTPTDPSAANTPPANLPLPGIQTGAPLRLGSAPGAAVVSQAGHADAGAAPAESLEAIRQRVADAKAREESQRQTDAEESFAKGRLAESEGKLSTAKIHYQMAYRRSSGALQQAVAERLQALGAALP